jgi:hypothetical protein
MDPTTPNLRDESDPSNRKTLPWWVISIFEFHVIFTILGLLFAFLYPAVNAARETHGQPLLFPRLDAWFGHFQRQHSFLMFLLVFAVGMPSLVSLSLLAIRRMLPPKIADYLPWQPVSRERPVTSDTRVAIVVTTVVLALFILLFAYLVSHED